jgi:phosphatidate cytidylyltransferase
MAPPLPDAKKNELKLRILSALVLAPIVLAAIVAGRPYMEFVMILSGLAMAWEWDRICGDQGFGPGGALTWAALIGVGVAVWFDRYDLALVVIGAAAIVIYIMVRLSGKGRPGWASINVIVVGAPCVAAIWLRSDPETGLRLTLWLVGAIWATDVGGYVFGRTIGGPKLAPRISPGKTWSGLGGAVLMAAAWGLGWAFWASASQPWIIFMLSGVTAVVAQCGDLGVSFVKRRFGVKDASNLIPGHGGVLDRYDGLLTTAPAVGIFVYVTHGGMNLWG